MKPSTQPTQINVYRQRLGEHTALPPPIFIYCTSSNKMAASISLVLLPFDTYYVCLKTCLAISKPVTVFWNLYECKETFALKAEPWIKLKLFLNKICIYILFTCNDGYYTSYHHCYQCKASFNQANSDVFTTNKLN